MHAARQTTWRVLLAFGLVSLTAGCESVPADPYRQPHDHRDVRNPAAQEFPDPNQTRDDILKQRSANEAAFKASNPDAKR